jgi:hypothetical protein
MLFLAYIENIHFLKQKKMNLNNLTASFNFYLMLNKIYISKGKKFSLLIPYVVPY